MTHRSGSFSTDINGFKAGVSSCTPLTYDTRGFVALLCAAFTVGLVNLDTKDSASDYRQSTEVGLGAAGLDLDLRYNFGKHLHLGLAVGGEMWMAKLTAERADGSELLHSRLFNANAQLGLGLHF